MGHHKGSPWQRGRRVWGTAEEEQGDPAGIQRWYEVPPLFCGICLKVSVRPGRKVALIDVVNHILDLFLQYVSTSFTYARMWSKILLMSGSTWAGAEPSRNIYSGPPKDQEQ